MSTQGYARLSPLLNAQEIADILQYLRDKPCYDPYRKKYGMFQGPDRAPAESTIIHYPHEVIVDCPYLVKKANHPLVLEVFSTLFGCKPTLSYLACWWSLAGRDEPEEAQLFHRDVDDWLFGKLFVYLTEVDEDAGPHIYVAGSQNSERLCDKRRFKESEVLSAFGSERLRVFCGPGGTSFLENTWGIHRGLPPRRQNRLVFQAVYSLFPLPYGPEHPFADRRQALPAQADRYVNRVYFC